MPEHLTPRELTLALAAANKLRQRGVPLSEISRRLNSRLGLTYEDLVADVKAAPRERAEPAPTLPEKALQVVQGASLGFLDELVDAVLAEGGGPPSMIRRRERLGLRRPEPTVGADIRETIARLRRQDPGGAIATEMIGAVASGVGTAGVLGAAGRSALARLGVLTGTGAGFGAVAGAGEGETAGERAVLAAVGGLSGAALGLLLGGGAEAARFVAGKVATKAFPGAVANVAARREIRQAAADVGLSAEEFKIAATAATARRPGLTVGADVEPFGDILEAAVQRAAPSRKARVRAISERGEGARQRVAQDIEELTGFGSIDDAVAVAQQRVDDVSTELFKPFDDVVVDLSDNLQEILDQGDVRKVWAQVRGVGRRADQPPTVERLRDLRSRLNSKARATADRGKARDLRRQSAELDAHLEDVIPEFRAANRGYYQANQVVNSFGRGAKALKDRLHGPRLITALQETIEQAGELGDEALQAFRHGAVDEAVNAITKVDDVAAGPVGRQVRAKLQPGSVLREVFESVDELEEMVERLYLEDGLTVMKNLRIRSKLTIDGQSEMLGFMQNAAVQGHLAAFYRALNTTDPAIARQMSNVIVDFLTTTGPTGQARLAAVMAKPIYSEFFRSLTAAQAAASAQTGVQTSRAVRALAGPLSDLLERGKSVADVLRDR